MASPGHIMLSYQWDYQKEVRKICEELRNLGLEVWMDLDSMSGDIFNKMAEGVEGAAIIIICMSSKYQLSDNCNKEFKYAQVKRKKILPIKMEKEFNATGALGLITAGKLYIDFSDLSKFDENVKSLEREVRSLLGEIKASQEPVDRNKADIAVATKMFPVCVGHSSEHACRIDKTEAIQCQPDFVFYGSETGIEDMVPFSVGSAGEGDSWRHIIVQGSDAGKRGWTHIFTFFAFSSKKLYTIPYAVGHAGNESGGWKYCVEENVKSDTDYQWPNSFNLDFVFYSFPVNPEDLTPIFVGSFPNHNIANIDVTCGADKNTKFSHAFSFQALSYDPPECFPFSVDRNENIRHDDDPRYRIREEMQEELVGYDDGWKKQLYLLFGFKKMQPGTIPIALGYKAYSGGRQFCITNNSYTVPKDWTLEAVFFAYPFDSSLAVSVAVGFESQYGCSRLGQADRLHEAYFQHDFTFCGYSYQHYGTVPISIGEAGAEDNHTLRSRVELGKDAGNRGWNHCFTVYAFKERKPGTFAVTVSHTDFSLGGWKYRVTKEGNQSVTSEWVIDFVFYAYPLPNEQIISD
ncbi:uncharacterized protein LOC135690596 isoform X2 [Rhopilema esculentum]|eukprot:gene1559-16007_t